MSMKPPSNFCPYKGLQPFTEEDREYFFGRESDCETVSSNLFVAPLTILYGASGVGKSSVLRAGVLPKLKQMGRVTAIFFNSWQSEFFDLALKHEILRHICEDTKENADDALRKISKALEESEESAKPEQQTGAPMQTEAERINAALYALTLDNLLVGCARAFRRRLLVIFDQFEEYFLYHATTTGAQGFDAEFARLINDNEANVNFMISMREDELSKLDRFRTRIPNMLSNLLRLNHLDDAGVEKAIREPLRVYDEKYPNARMDIEDPLVARIINGLKGIEGAPQKINAPAPVANSEQRIEMPYLQLVMIRLWNEEVRSPSRMMRVATLDRLGGAQEIVQTHLSEVMKHLTYFQRAIAARCFRHLVTPSGTKIALTPQDLADYANYSHWKINKIETLLKRLTAQDIRLLRSVESVGHSDARKYEIFHDALARPMLRWVAGSRKKVRRWVLISTMIICLIPALMILVYAILNALLSKSPIQIIDYIAAVVAIYMTLMVVYFVPLSLFFYLGRRWERSG